MKNNKRSVLLLLSAVALILLLVLVLSLASCRNGKKNGPMVGLCFRQSDKDPAYSHLLQERLTAAGYRVSVADAGNDQSRQNQQIEKFIKKEYEILIIEPVMVSAGGEIATQLKQAQMPAVFINREPEDALEQGELFSYVGCKEELHGILQGKLILQSDKKGDLNGDGTVSCVVITGPEDDRNARLQAEGCVKALTDGGQKVSLMATLWGEWTKESGRKCCADTLAQYGRDVEVIFCGNDTIAQGAAEAVIAGGWTVGTDYYLAGLGGTEEGLQMLLTGNLTGTVIQDLPRQTQQVLQVVEDLLQGNPVEKKYYVNCTPVDRENVDHYLP